MPLVFVHGVANRAGSQYDAGVATRDALLRRYLLAGHHRADGTPVTILNPYWGDLGGRLRWDGASLPLGDVEALGGEDSAFAELDAAARGDESTDAATSPVLAVARGSMPDAVDLLWTASALDLGTEPPPSMAADAERLAGLAATAARYAAANPQPAWVAEVRSDEEFLNRLEMEVDAYAADEARAAGPPPPAAAAEASIEEWESLGIDSVWQALRRGAARLRTAATGVAGREISDRLRPAITPSLSRFLGDVFVYLHQQNEVAGPIRERVAAAIRQAATLAEPGDPLVVVAHSMGGNIVYDLLTRELADVEIALLLTAGTQVSFFEELKLFRASDPALPRPGSRAKAPRPSGVRRWINVFDYSDVLGFELGTVIDGVEDFSFRTGSLLKAHTQYFLQPGFYERLAARLA
jgi:hypothetical protein